jgi:hypothetical protein
MLRAARIEAQKQAAVAKKAENEAAQSSHVARDAFLTAIHAKMRGAPGSPQLAAQEIAAQAAYEDALASEAPCKVEMARKQAELGVATLADEATL